MRFIRAIIAALLAAVVLIQAAAGQDGGAVIITTLSQSEILEDPGRLPVNGHVSTGQPDIAVLEEIAAAGYAAVIDLRGVDEDRGIDEKSAVESLGMRYVSLPIATPKDATFDNAAELDRILDEIGGPVLLHCQSGNRVGALFALNAKAEGASSEQALQFGRNAGLTRWESAVREIVDGQ